MKIVKYLTLKDAKWQPYFILTLVVTSLFIIPIPHITGATADNLQVSIVAVTPPDGSSITAPEQTFTVTVAYSGATTIQQYNATSYGTIKLFAWVYTMYIPPTWWPLMHGSEPYVDLPSPSGVVDIVWWCDTSWITNTSDVLHGAISGNNTVNYLFTANGYSANWAHNSDSLYVNYSVGPTERLPAIILSPNSGQPGSACTVTGSGFDPGETVQLTWGTVTGTPLITTTAEGTGNFSTQITIPYTMQAGRHSIHAIGTTHTASTTYTVDELLTAYFELKSCERTVTDSFFAMFDATGSMPEQDIVEYFWDFGDGNTERMGWGQPVVINDYAKQGGYTVSLTIKDASGKTHTYTQHVEIHADFHISLTTDRQSYEQGEAIVVSGSVLYKNQPLPSHASLDRLIIEFTAPNTQATGILRGTGANRDFTIDEKGNFIFLPFAGYNIGTYTLHIEGIMRIGSGLFEETLHAENNATVQVTKAIPVINMWEGGRLDTIIALYKEKIPLGPIRTRPGGPPSWLPESMYGSYHNGFLAGTNLDPTGDFACGGYQGQVLDFFDWMRFNENLSIRQLLKGLDTGPIERGLPNGLPGYHCSVVLYPYGTDWNGVPQYAGQFARVFDPWPKQKPEVVLPAQFAAGRGFNRVSWVYKGITDPNNLFSGYPLTGAAVYYNSAIRKQHHVSIVPRTSVHVQCPVDVLVTDDQGRRAGTLPNGTLIQEFSAHVYHATENNQTVGWYFGLPDGKFNIIIRGQAQGTFRLFVSGNAVGGKCLSYNEDVIGPGEIAEITIGTNDTMPNLVLPTGSTIMPIVERQPVPTTTIINHVVCRNVSDSEPIHPATTFSTQDTIFSWLNLTNASIGDEVVWVFHGPNNILELINLTLAYSNNVYCYTPLTLEHYNASAMIGPWQVTVYLNGKDASTALFEVHDSRKDTANTTPLGWVITPLAILLAFFIWKRKY